MIAATLPDLPVSAVLPALPDALAGKNRAVLVAPPCAGKINAARGHIVEEQALVAALQANRVAGAALDVFEVEPLLLDSPLLKMDNVMLALHNSNSSPAAWERVHWNTIKNLVEGLGMKYDETKEER